MALFSIDFIISRQFGITRANEQHTGGPNHTHTNENEAKKNERIDFNTTENWKERWAHFSISPKTHTREHL